MTTYIIPGEWTEQGARSIAAAARCCQRHLEEMGGRFTALYMTTGKHDLVLRYEASVEAVAAQFSLILNRLGAVRTKTLRAFPEAAYCEIDASRP